MATPLTGLAEEPPNDRSLVATWWARRGSAAEKPRPRSGVLGRKRVVGALREALAAVAVEALGMPQKAGDAAVDAIEFDGVCSGMGED